MVNSKKKTKKTKKEKKPVKKPKYSDIEHIVEYLVKTKSRAASFDCYSPEDIGQEIRIICFRALDHFDITRVKEDKWQNFFGRCVDNGLKNLKRDKFLRTSPPCKKDCEFLHGDEYLDNALGAVCKRWLRFRKNLQRKIKIRHPIPIDIIGDNIKDTSHEKEIEASDLEKHLLSSIPSFLRGNLRLMLDGKAKLVPRKEKKKIQELVRTLLDLD